MPCKSVNILLYWFWINRSTSTKQGILIFSLFRGMWTNLKIASERLWRILLFILANPRQIKTANAVCKKNFMHKYIDVGKRSVSSWKAISRYNIGVSVVRQGKRKREGRNFVYQSVFRGYVISNRLQAYWTYKFSIPVDILPTSLPTYTCNIYQVM